LSLQAQCSRGNSRAIAETEHGLICLPKADVKNDRKAGAEPLYASDHRSKLLTHDAIRVREMASGTADVILLKQCFDLQTDLAIEMGMGWAKQEAGHPQEQRARCPSTSHCTDPSSHPTS